MKKRIFTKCHFFFSGCQHLMRKIDGVRKGLSNNLHIIDLDASNLKLLNEICCWLEHLENANIIVICDLKLLPVARYLKSTFEGELDFFINTESIDNIILNYKHCRISNDYKSISSVTLSDREFQCLKSMLQGVTAKFDAKHLNLNVKTIYSHRESVANKLGFGKYISS